MERSKIVRRFLKDAMLQRLSAAYLPSQLSDAPPPPGASFLIAFTNPISAPPKSVCVT